MGEQEGPSSSGRTPDEQRSGQQDWRQHSQTAGSGKHRCCRGLLYFSQALHDQRKTPVCAGLRTTRDGAVNDMVDIRPETIPGGGFKYICVGLSVFDEERAKQQGDKHASADNVELPYCNGLEIISAPQVQSSPVLLKEGVDVGPAVAAQAPEPKPVAPRPGRSFVSQPSPDMADDFPEKFAKSARKLLHQMGHNLTLIGSAMKKAAENSLGKGRD
ncbi:hypothetical protein WJX72_011812 [[Myrmecia] bisecta]|uniref:DUF8204 domain-containing protein n=1 Tax=[Myrmecia] bisecta TaxID=41462 RepID=A0AAW1QGX7_9CHLO